eukprot:3365169-Rhodomonas_salina.1
MPRQQPSLCCDCCRGHDQRQHYITDASAVAAVWTQHTTTFSARPVIRAGARQGEARLTRKGPGAVGTSCLDQPGWEGASTSVT